MRCLVFSISFEVQCWHDVLTRRTRWSNNLNTCVDIVWILHGFRTRARHTRTLHAHVIRTLHAHATRALLKHPPYSLSAAPSGQPEAGRTAVDPSHAPAAHTHATHTHTRTRRTHAFHISHTFHTHRRSPLHFQPCKHPPYSLSAAPSGQPEAGRAAVDPSHTMHTHTMHTHETKHTHARCVCMYMFTHFSFDRSVPARIFKIRIQIKPFNVVHK